MFSKINWSFRLYGANRYCIWKINNCTYIQTLCKDHIEWEMKDQRYLNSKIDSWIYLNWIQNVQCMAPAKFLRITNWVQNRCSSFHSSQIQGEFKAKQRSRISHRKCWSKQKVENCGLHWPPWWPIKEGVWYVKRKSVLFKETIWNQKHEKQWGLCHNVEGWAKY